MPALPTRFRGDAVPTVQKTKASRSQAFPALPARRPAQRVVRGDWRCRVPYDRPDPGGGTAGGRRTESAPRILLVDDEGSIRTICRVNLESDGMSVVEASDGR